MDGLARCLWERLCPGLFTVWTTCHRDGSFVVRSDISDQLTGSDYKKEDNENHTKPKLIKNQIQNKIERSLKLFRIGGVAIMMGALLLNIPWILLVAQANDTTKPRWIVG